MFRHQLAVLPAVDSELLALGIVGGEAEEGPAAAGGGPTAVAAAPAAAVGNSYVDNLGKSGVKEVGAPRVCPLVSLHVALMAAQNCPASLSCHSTSASPPATRSRAAAACWLLRTVY